MTNPITRLREYLDLTQAELAEELGTHQANISRWEHNAGRLTASMALRIWEKKWMLLRKLEITLEDLLRVGRR